MLGRNSEEGERREMRSGKKGKYFQVRAIGSRALFLAILVLLLSFSLPANLTNQDNRLELDYSDLVDKDTLLRTGQNLGSALGSNNLKGALQPFLDKYSYLLEYAVEMINNEPASLTNVADKYPVGTEQPAWVALFRSGQLAAYTDSKKTVRLFLQGTNPQAAYNAHYSIVRHLLNSLKPTWGKLQVEIYAFENNYDTLSLKLNPFPALISGSYFGTPSGKIPLDLLGLSDFFNQGGQLEGAQINENIGLMLYAKEFTPQTLAGNKLQLSDFAVAYRAVFHAGDNKAFISLDPHKDITKTAVNFGGYLENTALGNVVLEADKRFKTITSGLDPNSGKDIRSSTRQSVANFLTVSERDFLNASNKIGWVKTRFWFYPDSIEVQTDTSKHFAKIINPYFLADAERSRDDFNSSAEFEKKKKALLLPAIRENIEDLNNNYNQYAKAFAEFRELVTVGRLMAICSWLYRVNPQWLDLDALLAVKIPAFSTERERTQLLVATTLSPGNYEKNADNIKKNLNIYYLSPDLDKSIVTYFTDTNDLAEFLSLKAGAEKNTTYTTEASSILKTIGKQPLRTLLKSQKDVQAFALFAGHKKQPAENFKNEIKRIEEENKLLDDLQKQLTAQEKQLRTFRANIASGITTTNNSQQQYNLMVEDQNKQIKEYQLRAEVFNKKVMIYNQNQKSQSPQIVEIGGGINLESESFKINTVESSPQLNTFKNITYKAKPEWTDISKGEKWITNKASVTKPEAQKAIVFTQPIIKAPSTVAIVLTQTKANPLSKTVPPSTLNQGQPNTLPRKNYIFIKSEDKYSPHIKGEFVDKNKIVFKRI